MTIPDRSTLVAECKHQAMNGLVQCGYITDDEALNIVRAVLAIAAPRIRAEAIEEAARVCEDPQVEQEAWAAGDNGYGEIDSGLVDPLAVVARRIRALAAAPQPQPPARRSDNMPCTMTGSVDGDRAWVAEQRADEIAKRLTLTTQVACEALAKLEAMGQLGKLSKRAQKWAEEHDRVDGKKS